MNGTNLTPCKNQRKRFLSPRENYFRVTAKEVETGDSEGGEVVHLDVGAILDRAKRAYGFKTDTQLREQLGGVSSGTLANWRRRGKIDLELIAAKCADRNLDYIVNGRGTPAGTDSPDYQYPDRSTAPDPIREPEAFREFLWQMTEREVVETPEQIAALELKRLRLLSDAMSQTIERMEGASKK